MCVIQHPLEFLMPGEGGFGDPEACFCLRPRRRGSLGPGQPLPSHQAPPLPGKALQVFMEGFE